MARLMQPWPDDRFSFGADAAMARRLFFSDIANLRWTQAAGAPSVSKSTNIARTQRKYN